MRIIKGLIAKILDSNPKPTKKRPNSNSNSNSKCLSLSLTTLKQLHAHLITTGLHLHQQNYIAVQLVTLSTTTSSFSPQSTAYARMIFDASIHTANVYLWTSMITAYSRHQCTSFEAILIYQKMHCHGRIKPRSFTLSSLLKACSFLSAVQLPIAKQIHLHVVMMGFDCYVYVQTALMDMYAKLGRIETATALFDKMPNRNVVTCNSMIVSCGKAGDVEAARRIFDEMVERDSISWTAMIAGYANSGNMMEAQLLFDQMSKKDVSSWNALITGYSRIGDWIKALQLFHEMCSNKFKPNQVTMAVIFSVCGHIGSLETAKQIHEQLRKNSYDTEMNTHVFNSLIDMYSKCGCVDESYRVFCEIPFKDIVSYNTMISGFAKHGHVEGALKLFKELLQGGLQPDQITFLGVLAACSHAGQLDMGYKYFISMTTDYGIEPLVHHYACMVDLLGRVGLVVEAYDLVKTMEVKPHAGVWGALLAACRMYVNVEIGEIAAEKLFEMEPENRGNYALLSNIYASAHMWDNVAKVRQLMRGSGVDKTTGVSWI